MRRDASRTLRVQLHERLLDSDRKHLILYASGPRHACPSCTRLAATHHGEPLTRPVERGAQAAQLRADGVAVLLLPREHLLQESLATKLLARDPALTSELLLNHRLGRNARVVGPCDASSASQPRRGSGQSEAQRTRHPKRLLAAHAAPAHDGVLRGGA